MKSVKVKASTRQIIPDILKTLNIKDEHLYCTKTNTRTITHFDIDADMKDEELLYMVGYARNQIFKNQYRIPMKALFPEPGNVYIAQKSPLADKSNNIRSAAKVIEPLNIGFDEYIRCIPINQNLELDTTFIVNVSVPYNSNTRYRFKSDQIVCKGLTEVPFDQNIDIGELDIGSEYVAKFKVKNVDLDIYDSYTLFTFRITDVMDESGHVAKLGFDIYTYDFMHVDLKYVFKELINIISNSSRLAYKDECIEFVNKCIAALK